VTLIRREIGLPLFLQTRLQQLPLAAEMTDKQKAVVEEAAQRVLDARKESPDATLADLYDPVAMPPKLAKAHADLDKAVDRSYRPEPFPSDRHRVEFLFTQ
jgi:hypothetical protein